MANELAISAAAASLSLGPHHGAKPGTGPTGEYLVTRLLPMGADWVKPDTALRLCPHGPCSADKSRFVPVFVADLIESLQVSAVHISEPNLLRRHEVNTSYLLPLQLQEHF